MRELADISEYNVLFMRKKDESGSLFGFPDNVDVGWITRDQILEKLPSPTMNARGLFKFDRSISAVSD